MKPLLRVLFEAGKNLADPKGYQMALLEGAWRHAVGPKISERTSLLGWQGRTLRIRCASLAWQKQLQHLRTEILEKLAFLGYYAPADIDFQPPEDERPRRRMARGGRRKKAPHASSYSSSARPKKKAAARSPSRRRQS